MYFRTYGLSKTWLNHYIKKAVSEHPLALNILKGPNYLWNLHDAWKHFDHLFRSLWGEMTWKISPLLSLEILGVFVNTSTSDYKYPVRDFENLQFPIQVQLSSKRKSFSKFFVAFMESPSNFKPSQKKKR